MSDGSGCCCGLRVMRAYLYVVDFMLCNNVPTVGSLLSLCIDSPAVRG